MHESTRSHAPFRTPRFARLLCAAVVVCAGLGCTPTATLDVVVTRARKVPVGQSIDLKVVRGGGAVDTEHEMDLEEGDRLTTGPDTFAFARFAGGSELVVMPSSELWVQRGRVALDAGTVLGKLHGAFRIDTPHGSASVVGTEVLVETARGATVVTVLEGLVGLTWPGGPNDPLLVAQGQRATLTDDGADPEPQAVSSSLLAHAAQEFNAVETSARGGRARLYVPQLIGTSKREALELVDELGLEVGEVVGRITGETDVNTVVDQAPTPGSRLPAYKKVHLWYEAEPVEVPDLGGVHRTRARSLLEDAGLAVEEYKRVTITGDVPENTVNHQEPAPGEVIRMGDPVKLRFEAASAIVPDMTGQTRAEAALELLALGLRLGTVTASLNEGLAVEGIQSQSPAAGGRVPGGTAIAVTMAMPAIRVPPVLAMSLEDATAALAGDELVPGRVSYKNVRRAEDDRFTCSVLLQTPAAGELAAVGSTVDLRLACE